MKTAQTLQPKLRFPEFEDDGDWEETSLKKLCEVNPSERELPDYFIYIDLDSVNGGVLKPKGKISKLDAPSRAQRVLENGDIIYQLVRPYQRNNLFFDITDKNRYVASTGYAHLRTTKSSLFIYHLIHTNSFVDSVLATCTGSSYPAINSSDLENISVRTPKSLPEQQKIADCLGSLDELLIAHRSKLTALQDHKKGLLQQLFPTQGQTTPNLHFPEFKGEWNESSLGEIIKIASGLVDPTKLPYSSLPHVGGENIDSHTGNLKSLVTASELGLISGKYLFSERDILYSKIRPALNKVATPGFKGICSADIYPLRPANSKLCRQYLAYLLLSDRFLAYAKEHSGRSKIPKINRDALLSFSTQIPQLKEQLKIADCLNDLASLITAETESIEALQTHKKGLMQNLFPNPDLK